MDTTSSGLSVLPVRLHFHLTSSSHNSSSRLAFHPPDLVDINVPTLRTQTSPLSPIFCSGIVFHASPKETLVLQEVIDNAADAVRNIAP